MSDYSTDVGFLRGQMASMLANNTEQFVWVITNALAEADLDQSIDEGQLGDDTNAEEAIDGLRRLADAIEAGQIT